MVRNIIFTFIILSYISRNRIGLVDTKYICFLQYEKFLTQKVIFYFHEKRQKYFLCMRGRVSFSAKGIPHGAKFYFPRRTGAHGLTLLRRTCIAKK